MKIEKGSPSCSKARLYLIFEECCLNRRVLSHSFKGQAACDEIGVGNLQGKI